MSWFLLALRKYATFEGRSRRSEYWYFVLFYLLIVSVLGGVDSLLGTYPMLRWPSGTQQIGWFGGLSALALLLPALAVTCRRLHDAGRSGWWQLIVFVPVLGAIVLLVFMLRNSASGVNEYGGNPKISLPYAQPRFG